MVVLVDKIMKFVPIFLFNFSKFAYIKKVYANLGSKVKNLC